MGREFCNMQRWVGNDCYYDYRDYMCVKCQDMNFCPEGLDGEYDDREWEEMKEREEAEDEHFSGLNKEKPF